MKNLILMVGIAIVSATALSGCGDDVPERQVYNAPVEQLTVQQCDRFYDPEEGGNTTRCFDTGNTACFTLYEPDGDTEYYCHGQKIWEIEPDDGWEVWDFDGIAIKKAKQKPKYVSNRYRATGKPPTVAPNPRSQALKAQKAVKAQQSLASTQKVNSTAKPSTSKTPAKGNTTVTLAKTPKGVAAPSGGTTNVVLKKTGVTTIKLAKPKPKVKKPTFVVKKKPKKK